MKNSRQGFPAQTSRYAVKVKNGAGWRDFNTVRLQISVGQSYHEQEKFAATIDWVRHRFEHVIICANDTLQRFNFEFEQKLVPQQAFQKALQEGDDWLGRNLALIDTLPSVEIHRWEDWKKDPAYLDSMAKTNALFKHNREFREAIEANIKAFWSRRTPSDTLSGHHRFAEFSRLAQSYLLEETAVFSMMFKSSRAVDVYPGSVLLPCVVFQGRSVEGALEGLNLGAFTRIDFGRNKSHILDTARLESTAPKPQFG